MTEYETVKFCGERGDTIPKVLRRTVERYGNSRVAFRQKKKGIWNEYTWAQSYEKVSHFSMGLIKLNMEAGTRIFLIGNLEPELYWALYAVMAMGAIAIAVPAITRREELKYLIQFTESKCVIVEDQEQVDKLLEMEKDIPSVERIIYWDSKGLWNYDNPSLMQYNDILKLGADLKRGDPLFFDRTLDKAQEDDVAMMLPTSGTTALPKLAQWTHKGLLQNIEKQLEFLPWHENEEVFSVTMADIYLATLPAMATGTPISLTETFETMERDRREVGWTSGLLGIIGPIASDIQVRISNSTGLKRLIYRLFLPVGYKIIDKKAIGEKPGLFWKLLYRVAYLVLFRPILDKYGYMKAWNPMAAGMVQSPELLRFFSALGVPVRNIYGMNECYPITAYKPGAMDFDTVGIPSPGNEIRLSESGEVTVREAPMCQGYYKNPAETATLIDESGWLHTGDAGLITNDGRIIILDRVKHMLTLKDSEVFAPAWIESKLKFSPFIDQATILGHDKEYVTALICINYPTTSDWAERNRIIYTSYVDLSQKPEVCDLIRKDIEIRVNRTLPDKTKVRRFALLPKMMDVDDAEITRTGKLRRSHIEYVYKDLIDNLYSDKDEHIFESEFTYEDGRKSTLRVSLRLITIGVHAC